MGPLVLASKSPRRAHLLTMLGIDFVVDPAQTEEAIEPGESPSSHVERLARGKAEEVARRHRGSLVLGADTVVVLSEAILGKPHDTHEAVEMLMLLSGRTHTVASGVALVDADGRTHSAVQITEVAFRTFDRREARDYVATGEPMDKAGAYGIQGLGAALVEDVRGDFYTVVGLPIPAFLELLRSAGYRYPFGHLEPLALKP